MHVRPFSVIQPYLHICVHMNMCVCVCVWVCVCVCVCVVCVRAMGKEWPLLFNHGSELLELTEAKICPATCWTNEVGV